MSKKKQKITAITYDHERRIVSFEFKRKLNPLGYGAKELIGFLFEWSVPDIEIDEPWDAMYQSKETNPPVDEITGSNQSQTGTRTVTYKITREL